MTMGVLYALHFPSGKIYIGITRETAEARFARHVKKANAGQPQAVCGAIRKYGRSSVRVETLAIAEWGYLQDLERRAIQVFKTQAPDGYNLTQGGEGVLGVVCRPETRAKISAANKGRQLTQEQRLKVSEALRRRDPPTAETRAKISVANKGRTMPPEVRAKCGLANVGRVISPEEKAKQRATVFAKGGGVCFAASKNRWLAYVKVARKTKIIGRFKTEAEARAARTEAMKVLHPDM